MRRTPTPLRDSLYTFSERFGARLGVGWVSVRRIHPVFSSDLRRSAAAHGFLHGSWHKLEHIYRVRNESDPRNVLVRHRQARNPCVTVQDGES